MPKIVVPITVLSFRELRQKRIQNEEAEKTGLGTSWINGTRKPEVQPKSRRKTGRLRSLR